MKRNEGEKERKKVSAGTGGRREALKSGKRRFHHSTNPGEFACQGFQEYLPRGAERNQDLDGGD